MLRGAVVAALRTPKRPGAQIPLLIRDIGLRQKKGYDLAHDPSPVLALDPVQAYLLQAWLLGPILRHVSALSLPAHVANRVRATAAVDCESVARSMEKPEGNPAKEWVTDKLTEKGRDIVWDHWLEWLKENAPEETWIAQSDIKLGFERASALLMLGNEVLQSIHATILRTSLHYLNLQDPNATQATAYGPLQTGSADSWPNSQQPPSGTLLAGTPLSFQVEVYMNDEYPPYVYCLGLAGLKIPHKGPVEGQ